VYWRFDPRVGELRNRHCIVAIGIIGVHASEIARDGKLHHADIGTEKCRYKTRIHNRPKSRAPTFKNA